MGSIRLTAADRERLGCPELLPVDLRTVTNREAIDLAKLGYATPRVLEKALRPKPVYLDSSQAGEDGKPVLDYVDVDWAAWTVFVWLALRRAGVKADPDTLEFDIDWEYIPDPSEIDEGPKGEPPAGEAT